MSLTPPQSSAHRQYQSQWDSENSSSNPDKKKIIVCCDGTACTAYRNDAESPPTNVIRIARCIEPVSSTGVPQVVHYIPGVGTADEWNPLNLYNHGTGRGVREKIIEGYSFICHNYKTSEDEVIVIGYSRGGFVARCIADMVCRIGVLTKHGLYYVRDAYELWLEAGRANELHLGPSPGAGGDGGGRMGEPSVLSHPSHDNEWFRRLLSILSAPVRAYSSYELPSDDDSDSDSDDGKEDSTGLVNRYLEDADEWRGKYGYHGDKDHGQDDKGEDGEALRGAAEPRSSRHSPKKGFFEPRLERDHLKKAISAYDPKIVRGPVQVDVCAAWDTVGALGPLTTRLGFFRLQLFGKLGFIQSDLHPGIRNAFQALALHDRRRSFLPIVWSRPPESPQQQQQQDGGGRLEQCWFMGCHSDIGGGRKGEGLAQFSLAWMLGKLQPFVTLDYDNFWSPRPDISNWYTAPDGTARVRPDSTFSLPYWLGGARFRRPRRQFWTAGRFDEVQGPDGLDKHASGERIHFTVRLLTEAGSMERCKSLRTAEPSRSGHAQTEWRVPFERKRFPPFPSPFRTRDNDGNQHDKFYKVDGGPERRQDYPDLVQEIILIFRWFADEFGIVWDGASADNTKPSKAVTDVMSELWMIVDDMILDFEPEMSDEGYTAGEIRELINVARWGIPR